MRPALVALVALSLAACGGPKREGPPPRPLPPEVAKSLKTRLMERFDRNGDGIAACDDTVAARAELFERLDTNADGALDPVEFQKAPFEDKVYVFHRFELLDKNADRLLDLPEFSSPADSSFQAADKDGDCRLSDDEMMMLMQETARFEVMPREDKNRRKPQIEPEPF